MIDPDKSTALIPEGPVTLSLHPDGVAHMRLNRPDVSNSLDHDSMAAMLDALMQVHGSSSARALLLTAAGKNFCGGGDVKVFRAQGRELPAYIRRATAQLAQIAQAMMRLNVPVIVAVRGYAAGGGGLGLVCSADLVVAGDGTNFLAGATRVGMVPDAGVTATLNHLVGFRRAMEILLLNRVVPASEALEIGLINRVVSDDLVEGEALAMAQKIAAGPPLANALTKKLMWGGLGGSSDAAMPEENIAQALLCATEDAIEGLDAVIERRRPIFVGR